MLWGYMFLKANKSLYTSTVTVSIYHKTPPCILTLQMLTFASDLIWFDFDI